MASRAGWCGELAFGFCSCNFQQAAELSVACLFLAVPFGKFRANGAIDIQLRTERRVLSRLDNGAYWV